MRNTTPIVLTLEIEPGSEPVGGRIVDESGTLREFAGWMGLARVIGDVLLATHQPQEDSQ